MAGIIPYETGDIVEMKKKHPCGSADHQCGEIESPQAGGVDCLQLRTDGTDYTVWSDLM